MNTLEKTLVLAKPDALQRGLVGEIISRLERKGLKLVGLKMIQAGDEILDAHYSHHSDKPFFEDLKNFMTSSPLVAMVWEGVEAVEAVRTVVGVTNSRKATPGTIRGDFGMSISNNIVHASEDSKVAKEEVERFFKGNELFEYEKNEYLNVYGEDER